MPVAENIQANIDAARDALAVIELCGEQPARFWERLVMLAKAKLDINEDDVVEDAMTYEEACQFERTVTMPYGAHKGESVVAVPCSYILWMLEGDAFTSRLRQYAASRRFADRQDIEGDDDDVEWLTQHVRGQYDERSSRAT